MSFQCDECSKSFSRRADVLRHKRKKHAKLAWKECVRCGKPVTLAEWAKHVREEHGFEDGHRDVHIMPKKDSRVPKRKLDDWSEQSSSYVGKIGGSFKFKHPFSMIVAGPTQSGKTHWVMQLLRERRDRIEKVPANIVYCYTHWQPKFDELKSFAPSTVFFRGLPHAFYLKSLENCLIVVDDLMDAASKDPSVMSLFTEGCHHKNISVIFLSQNIFHQGKHSRTMSLNVQYMVLFKNARDQSQIHTLARQMFPSDWRSFLQHYEAMTSEQHGHVILDLHPTTPNNKRIVTDFPHQVPVLTDKFDQMLNTQSDLDTDRKRQSVLYNSSPALADQFYRMSNPYAQPLLDAEEKMLSVLRDENLSAEKKVMAHTEALREFTTMKDNYKSYGISPPPTAVTKPPGIQLTESTNIDSDNESDEDDSGDGDNDVGANADTKHDIEDPKLMFDGDILPDGTDPKLISFEDTPEQRDRKEKFIKKHLLKEVEIEDLKPLPGEDHRLHSFEDTEKERKAKDRFSERSAKHYRLRNKDE